MTFQLNTFIAEHFKLQYQVTKHVKIVNSLFVWFTYKLQSLTGIYNTDSLEFFSHNIHTEITLRENICSNYKYKALHTLGRGRVNAVTTGEAGGHFVSNLLIISLLTQNNTKKRRTAK